MIKKEFFKIDCGLYPNRNAAKKFHKGIFGAIILKNKMLKGSMSYNSIEHICISLSSDGLDCRERFGNRTIKNVEATIERNAKDDSELIVVVIVEFFQPDDAQPREFPEYYTKTYDEEMNSDLESVMEFYKGTYIMSRGSKYRVGDDLYDTAFEAAYSQVYKGETWEYC